ncbi:MAG: glycerol-3-phosphate acyltransferase [Actinobacteria bacterium]|nr:glycerol-3-phosphate acyltransferase [Actinomycetota bacterium]MBU1493802.1 glycerol-3-phosphate acyltransferase [Actinomycetota bacterium]
MNWPEFGVLVGVAAGAYLIGSFPAAYLAGRLQSGTDVRTAGEGNVGARNVFHEVGKGWGVAVFAVDFGKGAAVALPLGDGPIGRLAVAVAFLILGHAFPIWLGFIGGKGLAAAGGFTAALMPWAVLLAGAAGLLVWLATHRFLPTVITVAVLTFVIAPFTGARWAIMAVALEGFVLTAVKRIIDEPRMRRIEAETGWNRATGGTR